MNDSCCSKPERCYTGMLERPRYFPRKLITDTEMTLDQEYVRNRLRMHNRMLHGWGVVCGALVRKAAKDKLWTVVVEKGLLLGPYGDDILIDCDREINLKSFGMSAVTGEPCPQAVDPWCSDVSVPREPGTYYVAVKYQQIKARPVPTQPVGCGCDDTECE